MFEKVWNWIIKVAGIDGVLHFGVCYAIVVTVGLLDWIAGAFIAFGISVFKESVDWQKHKDVLEYWKCIAHDLVFGGLGILVGACVCLVLK